MKLYTRTASLYWITMARICYDLRGVVILEMYAFVCVCTVFTSPLQTANIPVWVYIVRDKPKHTLPIAGRIVLWLVACFHYSEKQTFDCISTSRIPQSPFKSVRKTYNFNLIWPKKGTNGKKNAKLERNRTHQIFYEFHSPLFFLFDKSTTKCNSTFALRGALSVRRCAVLVSVHPHTLTKPE